MNFKFTQSEDKSILCNGQPLRYVSSVTSKRSYNVFNHGGLLDKVHRTSHAVEILPHYEYDGVEIPNYVINELRKQMDHDPECLPLTLRLS